MFDKSDEKKRKIELDTPEMINIRFVHILVHIFLNLEEHACTTRWKKIIYNM